MNYLARRLPFKTTALVLLALLCIPYMALAQTGGHSGSGLAIPVAGNFTDAAGGLGTLTGTLNIQRFVVQNGQLAAVGTLAATLIDSTGKALGSVVNTVTLPINTAATQSSCEILHLTLGPLDLNLLGLTVHLNQVVLDIGAQPGPGNLLGNLLCAVANLLNGNGALAGVANLLNQILGSL